MCQGGFLAVLLLAGNLHAAPGFDTSSPVNYFSSIANRFFITQTNFIIPLPWPVFVPGVGFQNGLPTNISTGFIPVYPTNYYTPSVHRILQLSANVYDASTNKTSAAPDDFDYPSVFWPVFGANFTTDPTQPNIWIKGYVEVTNAVGANADYNFPAYSLSVSSDRLAILMNAIGGSNNFNVYGVPWIIGAKKGLPNLNQVSLESFSAITRKLQIVKPSLTADRSTWHTNVQYIVGISNAVVVEAWNSYQSNYSRAVDMGCSDALAMTLTNENGVISPAAVFSTNFVSNNQITVLSNAWSGAGQNWSSNITSSFRFPLLTSVNFMPGDIYSTNTVRTGTFVYVANPLSAGFENTVGYPLPRLGMNLTNRLRFVMVDHATGRVIDYVQLDGMVGQRDFTGAGEMMGPDDWGPGGVWDTNRIPTGSGIINAELSGIENQIEISQEPPPFVVGGYYTPVFSNDWNSAVVQSMGFSSIAGAAQSFNAFFNKNTTVNSNLSMQVPFTPTRTVCVYYTWQANDPLVHYTLSDLIDLTGIIGAPWTNWVNTNLINGFLGQINQRYMPWGGSLNGGIADYNMNLSLKDPMVTRSDDWNFPAGSLNFGSIGSVHRGTPWQTVYLKSAPVDPTLWLNWIGDVSPTDATVSQPKNDWHLVPLLAPLLNPVDPRQLSSANQPDFAALLDGLAVVTNSAPSVYLTMSSNSLQAAIIADGVNALRAAQPGGIFMNLGDILAAPELSVSSPWFDFSGNGDPLTDSDYELIPSQLLARLRPDSVGSVMPGNGGLQIVFTGMDGFAYQVQASTNLTDWVPLATEFTTNGTFVFTDPAGVGLAKRYYRTSLLPNN